MKPMSSAGHPADEHPLIVALRNAPLSDLPLTDEEIAALEAAKGSDEWRAHAEVVAALERKKPAGP